MLTIPEPIQALFKRDNVLKNLRITFPNGEHDDICNDKIVNESMVFSESLFTGSPVVFGLCEASSLSFDCVGIDSIRGLSIFAYIEIDISSLTGVQKMEWGHTSADVPFVYYPVPLGLFVVDECKRRADFNIRNVVAYSPFFYEQSNISTFSNMMPYDKKKAIGANWGSSKTMTVDWRKLAVLVGQQIFDYNDLSPLLLDSKVTKSTVTYSKKSYRIAGYGWDGEAKELELNVTWKKWFKIDLNAWDYNSLTDTWSVIDCKSLPWDGGYVWWWGSYDSTIVSDFNAMKERIRQAIKSIIKTVSPTPSAPNIDAYVNNTLDKSCYSGYIEHAWKINKSSNPVAPTSSSSNGTWNIPLNSYFALNGEPGTMFPMEIEVKFSSIDGQTETVISTDTFDLTDSGTVELAQIDVRKSELFGYNSNDPWSLSAIFRFIYSSEEINERQSFAGVWEEIPFNNIIKDILEVNGMFGGMGRNGKFRLYDITKAIRLLPSYEIFPSNSIYPCSSEDTAYMTRSDYIEAWYDENVTYYGSIYVKYKDANNNDAEYIEYLIDDEEKAASMPIYDLSGNELFLKSIDVVSVEAAIENIKNTIKALAYFQAEISMRALPYMEIGDMLFIRAKDDAFATPIISQNITGIQDLRNTITSD